MNNGAEFCVNVAATPVLVDGGERVGSKMEDGRHAAAHFAIEDDLQQNVTSTSWSISCGHSYQVLTDQYCDIVTNIAISPSAAAQCISCPKKASLSVGKAFILLVHNMHCIFTIILGKMLKY